MVFVVNSTQMIIYLKNFSIKLTENISQRKKKQEKRKKRQIFDNRNTDNSDYKTVCINNKILKMTPIVKKSNRFIQKMFVALSNFGMFKGYYIFKNMCRIR